MWFRGGTLSQPSAGTAAHERTLATPELPPAALPRPKHARPKIATFGIEESVASHLRAQGFLINTGTLGMPYRVKKDDGFKRVIPNHTFPPNLVEHDVVVIDLQAREILERPEGEPPTALGDIGVWAKQSSGIVDPRALVAQAFSDEFESIYKHGGLFVVFAAPERTQDLKVGYLDHWSQLIADEPFNHTEWSFLPILRGVGTKSLEGQEIEIVAAAEAIRGVAAPFFRDSRYSCTLHWIWTNHQTERWVPLATNRFGDAVAAAITPHSEREGWIFIFPHVQNQAAFLSRLFSEFLPQFRPEAFPEFESSAWLSRDEYELSEVLTLKQQVAEVKEKAEAEIARLEAAIVAERDRFDFLQTLLTGTGDALVAAVRRTLNEIGFQQVVDVDRLNEGETRIRREDLRIHDQSPLLLVEVKGINGLPTEAQSLAAWKYVAPRMRELDRLDVQALAVINHQRQLPPLERNNDDPFGADVVTNARENGFGLLTTWDLYQLYRNYKRLGWRPEHVQPLLYQRGRINPVPSHYTALGVVEVFAERVGVVGVRIEAGTLRRGERIAFELPTHFIEQAASSLELNRMPVESVVAHDVAGIRTEFGKLELRKGVRVFVVRD